ncbi:high mobility group protein [Metarhizium album ARSEF 1941]|uniref:High mobility group protein n=1 Tax=Metarhizium album (strain ARSEF 1941) TaxID=1081103 RepID=A0A0B2WJW0_METAS|nr:high mobility group protein [Metarhizium album ARSEF 1941]KHN96316.1 high mobility group protein [Metarhizium album ARSEF 1941]
MTQELERIFADLGLSQYLDAFIDQGFDAWEIILDIQESDLDALGVKLGHRRKLQRRIANARGIAPSVSLSSPVRPGSDESKQDGVKRDSSRPDGTAAESNGVTKRKYRRHPKPDPNSPERPPSAYVLFSNSRISSDVKSVTVCQGLTVYFLPEMREDLKSHNLTFTEIAKLVGENWQSLQPAEKDTYESQANAAKEKYNRELGEYKKTPEYRKYSQYLHDFKEKQAKQYKGQDGSKRAKVEPARLRHGSTSSSATPNTTNSSASGSSSSERLQGSEPPPTRRDRVDSTTSLAESPHSSAAPTPVSAHNSYDDAGASPQALQFDNGSPADPHHPSRHQPAMRGRGRADSMHQHLPSVSDMLDGRQQAIVHPVPDGLSYPSRRGNGSARTSLDGASFLPGGRPPTLRHESSSNSTNVSGSSVGSFGRLMGEGPLPIHALLSDRNSVGPSFHEKLHNPILSGATGTMSTHQPLVGLAHGPSGYGFQSDSSPFHHMKVEQSSEGDVVMTTDETPPPPRQSRRAKDNLDGMDALLRAGEIVGRGGRR